MPLEFKHHPLAAPLLGLLLLLGGAFLRGQQGLDIFSGNRAFSDEQLFDSLFRRSPDFPRLLLGRPDALQKARRRLERYYRDRGFPLARVDVGTAKRLPFKIHEGPRAPLARVQFRGNSALSSKRLAQLVKLGRHLDPETLEQALARIRQAYHNEGYLKAEVGPAVLRVVEVEERDNFPLPFRRVGRTRTRLIIPIREGRMYRYGRVEFPHELPLEGLFPPESGQTYREDKLLEFRRQLEMRLRRRGKLVRKLEIYQHVRDQDQRVDLRLRYQVLPTLLVGKIEFRGNVKYPDFFYRREMRVEEQQLLDPARLEESLKNLHDTGVLTSYSVELNVHDAISEADIIIHLEEKDRQKVAYSFGSDNFGGTESSFFYSIVNLLGLGEILGLDVNLGSQNTGFAATLASRYLFGTTLPMTTALKFFRRHTGLRIPNADDTIRRLFRINTVGVSASTSYRINSDEQAGVAFSAERFSSAVTSTNWVLEPFWSQSRSNDWTSTGRLRVSNRFSLFRGPLDSWNMRPTVDYRRYFAGEFPDSPVLAMRFHASHARFFGRPAPVTERLFADAWGVRGFNSISAGPWARFGDRLAPVGGDTLLVANAEYRVPLSHTFTSVPFFDTGLNLGLTSPEGYSLLEGTRRIWRASLGHELQVHLPGGLPTTRFIYAWNPLRLDRHFLTPGGLARLHDPAHAFRIALGPSF